MNLSWWNGRRGNSFSAMQQFDLHYRWMPRTLKAGARQQRGCFSIYGLESSGFAVGGRGCPGKGVVHNLIDGVDGLAFAGAAAHVEDAGN